MPFTIRETKTYQYPSEIVYQAALGAIGGLEGKVISEDAEAGQIQAKFDKKILGKVLGDRTQIELKIDSQSLGESTVGIEIYPLDPLGRKLMFGARKGVSRTVANWFIAHLEHRLPEEKKA
jgi:ribosomal protein L35AE/L33A